MSTNLKKSLRDIPNGMLSSPQIAAYLRAGLLVVGHKEHLLKGATYDMRLGNPAYRFVDGIKEIFNLGKEADHTKGVSRTLILPPNSLTFITTIEEFKLPRDVIARYNLKSRWVHKGLLLGTGPIVDPEFEGHLYIPIHNFSSKPVDVDFEAPFIVVEFTKTLCTDNDYKPNPSKRGEIIKYLETAGAVESSVFIPLRDSKIEIELSRAERTKWNRWFTWGGLLSFAGIAVGLLSLTYTTWSIHTDTRQKILAAHEALLTISARLEKENEKFRKELLILNEQVSALSVSGALSEGKIQNFQVQLPTDVLNTTPREDKKAQTSPPLIGVTSTHHNKHAN